MIQIDVYSYPEHKFLGTRFAPMVINNADLINNQVDEVRKLWGKNEKDSCFKTKFV